LSLINEVNKEMNMRNWLVVMCTIMSGCGVVKDIKNIFDPSDEDEMTGQASSPVPVDRELETPATPDPYPPGRKIYSSVGFYSRGYLWSRDEITSNSLYTVSAKTLRRQANYVSIYASDLLRQAVSIYRKNTPTAPAPVLWDMSGPLGGPLGGHLSHRVGLDIDVEYEYMGEKSVRNIDYNMLWSAVSAWVETGQVRRIFVDERIKRKLCSLHLGEGDEAAGVLRRLRPYVNHDDHFHVRLKCQRGDDKCIDQVDVPLGSGC
jgi:penicillin-insensitive murein endopeptidase